MFVVCTNLAGQIRLFRQFGSPKSVLGQSRLQDVAQQAVHHLLKNRTNVQAEFAISDAAELPVLQLRLLEAIQLWVELLSRYLSPDNGGQAVVGAAGIREIDLLFQAPLAHHLLDEVLTSVDGGTELIITQPPVTTCIHPFIDSQRRRGPDHE